MKETIIRFGTATAIIYPNGRLSLRKSRSQHLVELTLQEARRLFETWFGVLLKDRVDG